MFYLFLYSYEDAIRIFEQEAEFCANFNLLKFNSNDFFVSSVICQLASLAIDSEPTMAEIKEKLKKYKKIDYTFPELKQGNILYVYHNAIFPLNYCINNI
jgi:hypothetical protein